MHDVIVVGSGAGAAAAAYRLVKRGLSVLMLEKGKALPRDGSTLSTFSNWSISVDFMGRDIGPNWAVPSMSAGGAVEDCFPSTCSFTLG